MNSEIRIAELFAGVGGFRLGLEGYDNPSFPEFTKPSAGKFKTVWANQWEPPGTVGRQFAARCYQERFGDEELVVEDINQVLNEYEEGLREIPDIDMLVGGFPCQDYSVAKTLSNARGIEGKKGVLWWDIERFISYKKPRYVLLENVDRLLKSPSSQRGRDFAIMLSCLCNLGYSVEWQVVNSAEYGASQRRKRVYIFAVLTEEKWDLDQRLMNGVMPEAFPVCEPEKISHFDIDKDTFKVSNEFGIGKKTSPFETAGVCQDFKVATHKLVENYKGELHSLGDVLIPEEEVEESFFISEEQRPRWEYLKGGKREKRVDKKTGYEYFYSEGSMSFPDALDKPSRTILTGEGGTSPSRFKHAIETSSGRLRRLVPDELDQLQGFPRGWTDTGMTDGNRAFCMGNALVTMIPHRIGKVIASRHESNTK